MKYPKGSMPKTKSLGQPPSKIGGGLGGVTEPGMGAIAAGATLRRGGNATTKGVLRSGGEKGRAHPDNIDKVAPKMDY